MSHLCLQVSGLPLGLCSCSPYALGDSAWRQAAAIAQRDDERHNRVLAEEDRRGGADYAEAAAYGEPPTGLRGHLLAPRPMLATAVQPLRWPLSRGVDAVRGCAAPDTTGITGRGRTSAAATRPPLVLVDNHCGRDRVDQPAADTDDHPLPLPGQHDHQPLGHHLRTTDDSNRREPGAQYWARRVRRAA